MEVARSGRGRSPEPPSGSYLGMDLDRGYDEPHLFRSAFAGLSPEDEHAPFNVADVARRRLLVLSDEPAEVIG